MKAVITETFKSMDEMGENIKKIVLKEFDLNKGDLIVITGGFPLGETTSTNSIRIVEI